MTDRTKKPLARDVSTMKPKSAKKNRPVAVKRSAMRKKHYARPDR